MTTVTRKKKYSVCQCVLPLIGPNVVIHELCKGKVCMTNKHKTSVCPCILPLNGPNVVFMSYAKVKCA